MSDSNNDEQYDGDGFPPLNKSIIPKENKKLLGRKREPESKDIIKY